MTHKVPIHTTLDVSTLTYLKGIEKHYDCNLNDAISMVVERCKTMDKKQRSELLESVIIEIDEVISTILLKYKQQRCGKL